MLRVVIADDEERICQLIQALGEWHRLGLEVAGTASNGPDALQMIRTLLPDILITDIRMPGCDGLTVVQEARKFVPGLEVIVISGYAQFDYAQTAIRFGVGEYLLKPINRDALNHSLAKMAERCRARQKQETEMETLLVSRDDDRQLLRAQLVADLLAARLDVADREALTRTYRFSAEGSCLQLMMLKMDFDPADFSDASLTIVREKARDLFQPTMDTYCADAVLDFSAASMIGVMSYQPDMSEPLRSQLRNNLNHLAAERGLYGPIEFSLALGPVCQTPPALAASLPTVHIGIAERLIEGTGRLLEGEVGRSGLLEMDYQTRYTTAASYAIDLLQLEEADRAADVVAQANTLPGVHGWELLSLYRAAGLYFLTRLNPENSDAILAEYQARLAQCSTAAALTNALRVLQRDQLTQYQQRLKDRDTQPIRAAKLYILKHFDQPITLEEVSSAIGFSENYFSTLFKKETGSGFTKYLTHVRMDEARTRLRDTNQSVAEICKQVGYGDLKHFTHTFKAETGLTPGEYRKLYG